MIEARDISAWGRELGFGALGIARIDLPDDEAWLKRWLALGRHGEMNWMARHGTRRSRPAELIPGTVTVISVRMDYFPPEAEPAEAVLADRSLGYISRYALGRDYHKVLRQRLQRLAERIAATAGPFGYRVFTDSAPVLEKALARDAGLGWIGKHTNLLSRDAGSWFFLGEIYTDLPLPADEPGAAHCGSCTACIEACPTAAIVAPYELDARLCISYLTIEHPGAIPMHLRPAMGNRIYGCDDCQLVCPWNRYAQLAAAPDFRARHGLDASGLVALFSWTEAEFLERTLGSAIRRIGHERWLRNISIALGNAAPDPAARSALLSRANHDSPLVREHVAWALEQHQAAGRH
ncbi:tRNA epoxyqueuosine(34) reductase QueG [Wenzhouxiangella sp. XN24]|uniref:tRNA epoxyqueuosine(34) reductase QueG n=1 Tax=Wenzhouxiangella sp. XN24 TaxID=2713569 RepID=UPI0013EB95B3|nr:tRNA epoxyqueuosine(34) reductase QueG [Wenzhouxiangella sp. XN24]NGX15504.1 tRNA epoxyqueuosine(34) reductase QueG [Wenzhouxiangella sp. XN24]